MLVNTNSDVMVVNTNSDVTCVCEQTEEGGGPRRGGLPVKGGISPSCGHRIQMIHMIPPA